jgi:hypothetical protein
VLGVSVRASHDEIVTSVREDAQRFVDSLWIDDRRSAWEYLKDFGLPAGLANAARLTPPWRLDRLGVVVRSTATSSARAPSAGLVAWKVHTLKVEKDWAYHQDIGPLLGARARGQ